MGQPPPQPGPQGPFPGQPGQTPQGPPPGYGQQPPQGPPPGHGQRGPGPQGPPPGFAPQGPPPQGPPPGYGQQPPQYPPPGYGPQGPGGPEQPKKKTGLIVGGAIGAVVLIAAIGGIAAWAASGGEYVSMPDDCALLFEGNSLEESDFGPTPAFDGGFDPDGGSTDGSYGEMTCEGESGDLMVSFHVELFDMEHPDTEEQLQEILEEEFDPEEEFGAQGTEPGEVSDLDLEYGPEGQALWDESSIGERGMTMVSTMDSGEFGDSGSFGASVFLSGNAVGAVVVARNGGDADIETVYATVESSASDLQSRISRVAEK